MTDRQPRDEDEDLRARFSALRRDDARRVLDYQMVRARRPGATARLRNGQGASSPRANRLSIPRWTFAFAAAAVGLIWLFAGQDSTSPDPAWPSAEWLMPTDALLDLSSLPGDALLHEIPEIGTLPVESPAGAQNPDSDWRTPA